MRDKLITLSYLFDGNAIQINEALRTNLDVKINYNYIESLKNSGIEVITSVDDDYPFELKALYNLPHVIYCLGEKSLLKKEMFAIIGSRCNLKYSQNVCQELIKSIDQDIVIVSGLAKGIDYFAHKYALEYGRKTIAILGSGFKNIYPKQNYQLAKLIGEYGLLISEYPPNVRANKINFPLRNRLIAALSKRVYVIEAALKSGSLITANIALDLGKDIYCAPGSIFEKNYEGSHKLINDGAYLLDFRNEA